MRVVLVHGLLRTRWSLRRLARALRAEGCQPELFGYVAARESFESIAARLAARLERADGAWCAVGHSLGGLLLRAAISTLPSERRASRLVQLGTPNVSPRLARRLHRTLPYRVLHGDSGRLLADPERMARLPWPGVPVTVVAGTAGPRGRFSPFGGDPNDGLVAVEETTWPGAERVELPVRHTFMMNDREVRRVVLRRCGDAAAGRSRGQS